NGAEADRAVYVPADAIDPRTGAAADAASRRFADFGTVREVSSLGRSRTLQLGASAIRILTDRWYTVGYTWTDGRESIGPLGAPGGAPASAGATALELASGPSGYAPRQVLYATFEQRLSRTLTLAGVGRLQSGTPFTPMISGDVNGDGASNDRAFVFD